MNPWLILTAVIAVGVAAAGGYHTGKERGMAEVQQAWDNEKTAQYAKYTKAVEEARKREQELQVIANNLSKEKHREMRELLARNTALANSLRDRQSRPSSASSTVPSSSGVGTNACTGAQLYRQDGEFLVGIAREADELLVALKQCYAQYDAVRQAGK